MSDHLELLRRFLAEHLPPGWMEAVAAGDHDTVRRLRHELDQRDFVRRLGAAGWVAPHWPTEHGGRGLDDARAAAVIDRLDELSAPRVPRGVGFVLAAPAIRRFASAATKRRFLPAIVTGEEQWAQLFSEPGAGSDLASLATRAERDGDEWVVTGQKVWSTLAHEAQFGILLARTDPAVPKNRGITYFAVDLRSPGVEVRPLRQLTGETEFSEIFLDQVRLPDLYRISPVGEGWAASGTTLSAERVALSGTTAKQRSSRGILGGKTIEEVMAMARTEPASEHPARRQRLALAYTRAQVLGHTVDRMTGPAGSVTKIAKAAWNQSLQEIALDLLGARSTAWPADDPAMHSYVREFLRTRANSIEGGTSEIQRNVVGERVLGLPREPDPYAGRPWNEVPRS